jgi:hypothetical protein
MNFTSTRLRFQAEKRRHWEGARCLMELNQGSMNDLKIARGGG